MASLIGVIGIVVFIVTSLQKRRTAPATPGRIPRWLWLLALFLRLNLLGFWFAIFPYVGNVAALLSLLVIGWFVAPEIWIRVLVRPFAPPRVVYWSRRYSTFIEAIMPTGLSTMHAAVALTRRPNPRTLDWLALKLTQLKFPRGAAIVAAGLLAAMRGDRQRARSLMRLADALPPHLVAEGARAIARDWLVVEAARAGDWRETQRLGRRGRRSLRFSLAIARMGERIRRDPRAPGDTWLVLLWSLAPRRRATLALLRVALRHPRLREGLAPLAERECPVTLGQSLKAFPGDAQGFAKGVGAVDFACDQSSTRARVEMRMLALGARRDPEVVLERVKERLQDLLAPLIEASPHLGSQSGRSSSLDAAVAAFRSRLYRDIEARCADYSRRTKAGLSLEPINEWEAWAALRDSAEQLLTLSPSATPTLFQIMYAPVNNFGVFQQNIEKRPSLAHEMYAWLLGRCGEDEAARALLSGNLKRAPSS